AACGTVVRDAMAKARLKCLRSRGGSSMSLVHKRRVGAGCLAVLVAGCGTATSGGASHISPSTTTTTLMTGWQQKFDLDWQVKPEPGGTQRIQGYVVSRYGRKARPGRVLRHALCGS